MKFIVSRTALFLTAVALLSIPYSSSFAGVDDKSAWTMNASDDGRATLFYGDGSEESGLVFSCKLHSGNIRIFIGETDASLRPYVHVSASITIGAKKAVIRGRTLPNELAGVSSFQGSLPAADPLFESMTKAASIVMRVGNSRQEIPLKTMAGKSADFNQACRKS